MYDQLLPLGLLLTFLLSAVVFYSSQEIVKQPTQPTQPTQQQRVVSARLLPSTPDLKRAYKVLRTTQLLDEEPSIQKKVKQQSESESEEVSEESAHSSSPPKTPAFAEQIVQVVQSDLKVEETEPVESLLKNRFSVRNGEIKVRLFEDDNQIL